MGTIRSLISLAAIVAVGAGTGCSSTGFWKSKKDSDWKVPEGVPSSSMSPQVKPDGSGVVQAGGTSPFATMPASLAWLAGKDKVGPKVPAVQIAVAWQNKVDYLPDPARDGAMGPGLAGQVFLFGARMQPATADGTLTVDLYDETPRPPGVPANKPERWQFKKDVLRALRSVDERFGQCYVLFLPWPTYRPDVTRVRIRARFDPDQGGFPLYAPEETLALDTATLGAAANRPQPLGASTPPTTGPGLGVFTMGPPGAPSNSSAASPANLPIPVGGSGNRPTGSATPDPYGPAIPIMPSPPVPGGYAPGAPIAPGAPMAPVELPPGFVPR